MSFWNNLLMAFITLFVAVDPLGLMPVAEGLMAGTSAAKRRRVIIHGVAAAFIVGVGFLFLGEAVLRFLGITVGDFKVAGGVLLFVLALKGLISNEEAKVDPEELGAVPLGVPLIVGPAVLTSLIVLYGHYGLAATMTAFIANLIITGVVLWAGQLLMKLLGSEGAGVMSKISNLLLAAFAVMMIRLGIQDIIAAIKG